MNNSVYSLCSTFIREPGKETPPTNPNPKENPQTPPPTPEEVPPMKEAPSRDRQSEYRRFDYERYL